MSRPTLDKSSFTATGLSPTMAQLPRLLRIISDHWPGPRSLATTNGVSVDVLSSGYLDVSVPRVCFLTLCIQLKYLTMKCRYNLRNGRIINISEVGFPIQKSPDQRLLAPPRAYRSVPRLSSPLTAKASTRCPFDA